MKKQSVRLVNAEQERTAAVKQLTDLARILYDEGTPVAEIARLAGVTRLTVYRWLENTTEGEAS